MHFPRLVPAALAAVLVLAGSAFAGDLEDGIKLKEAGKWEEALAKVQKAYDADPTAPEAALELSAVLVGLGKFEKAAKVVSDAIEAHPQDARLLLAKGRGYMLYAGQLDSERANPQMILAYAADGDKWVKKALEIEPKNSEARVWKAKVLQYQGADSANVQEELNAILADDPKCFEAHWELAEIWYRAAWADNKDKKKWAAAEKHYRDAYSVDPASGQALLKATYAKQWQQTAPAAVMAVDYGQCCKLLPEDPAPLTQLWKLRKYAAAEVRAELEALAKEPKVGGRAKAFVLLMDAQAAVDAGKPADAVKGCLASIKSWGNAPSALGEVYDTVNGIAYLGKGLDAGDRDKLWGALLDNWPDRFESPSNAGLWYRDVGRDDKKSAEWYMRAAKLAPNSPQVQNDTGVIFHYNLRDPEKGEPYYRRAIAAAEEQGLAWSNDPKRDPEGVGYRDALNNLAIVLQAGKRLKELREFAEEHVPEDFPGRAQWLHAGEK